MPARLPALADVEGQVRAQLVQKLAGEMAIKKGQERLEAIKASDTGAGLGAAVVVSRAALGGLSPSVVKAILSADASKVPAYVGTKDDAGGYVLARINKVLPRDPVIIDPKRAAQQYAQAWTTAESQAYYEALKSRYKTVIKANVAAPAGSQ